MNDTEFEKLLRAIKPAEPGAAFERQIAFELSASEPKVENPTTEGWLSWLVSRLGWAALGATTALTISAVLRTETTAPQPLGTTSTSPSMPTFIQRSAEILNANDEGITLDGEQGMARQVRFTSIERSAWVDATGAEMLVEVPREELVLIPVSYQ